MEILAGTNRLDLARKQDRTYTFATQFLFNQPESDVKKRVSCKEYKGNTTTMNLIPIMDFLKLAGEKKNNHEV